MSYAIFFIFYLFLLFNISHPNVIKHKFAILLNFEKDDSEFESISTKIQNTINDVLPISTLQNNETKIDLSAQIIFMNSTSDETREINRLQITREVVCRELLNDSIAVILLQHSSVTKGSVRAAYSAAAYALGFYRVPAIGVMIQDAEFSRKNLYPTFLRTSPPFSNEAQIMLKLLNKLKYRQVVVLTVEGDVNGQEFTTAFEEYRIEYEIHVQKYIELFVNDSLAETLAKEFEEVTSNTVILCAKKVNAETIFSYAQNLTGLGKMWVVNEAAAQASNIPKGFLSIHLKQNAVSALRDALVVLKNGVKILQKFNGTVLPPAQCTNASISNEWTNTVGTQFYRHLIESTIYGEKHQIKFNSKGDRVSIAYEILNRQFEKFLVVGFCNDEGDLFLEEAAIIWPGGTKTKPLEITLPKHLRAVVISDAPYVYTFEVDNASKCSTFKILQIDDVNVPGPWLPCPLRRPDSTTNYCCAGYAIDLLFSLSISEPGATIDTGFTFELHLNTSYGSVHLGELGYSLSGMIGELDADLADIAVGALTINYEREQYIDFTEPFNYHGIRVLEKWRPRDSPMQSFLQPLKPSLWYTLLSSVLLVGLTIYILDLKSPFDRFYHARNLQIDPDDPFWEKTEDDRVTFSEAMWFVWGVLLNSGVCEKTPRSFSARLLGLVWCGFTMGFVASYTANLAAFLVLDTPEKSLSGVSDPRLRNPSANFSYATVLDTNTYQYFKRHVELSTMFRKMEGHNVQTAKEAIDALLNGTLGAFIWDSTRLDFEATKNCELRTRGALFGRAAYGVGLQKHSPWTQHLTNAILRLSENGMMEDLDTKWIRGAGKKPCVYETHKTPTRLGLVNMRDIFVLVTGGILLGAVFCIFEVKIGRRKARDLKRKQLARRYANMWLRKIYRRKRSQLLSPPTPRKFSEIIIRAETLNGRNTRLESLRNLSDSRLNSKAKPHRIRPDHNFTTKPVKCYCSRCRNAVETRPRACLGKFTYISVAFFILLLLWPCAPLPCFLTVFADYLHVCPICGHIIGRFCRGGKPKFYV